MKKLLHRVWAEINLDALGNNIREIKEYTKNKDIMAVVKANAYGHGVGLIAPELFRLGINKFCVSNMGEAKELRDLLPKADILIFGGNEEEWFSDIVNLNLIQTVGDTEFAKTLSDFAVKNNVTIRVHIKVDTGMSRIGIESKEELQEITALKGLKIEGVYTHFACSDSLCENEIVFTKEQERILREISSVLPCKNIPVYSQNSGGILYHPDFSGEIVRSGIITYGCMPSTAEKLPIKLTPVLTLKSQVCQVKTIPAGRTIGYGRAFTVEKDTEIAVIPVGYADGYSRRFSNNGSVYINGKFCPIRGRVCMDQMMVDVTGAGVKAGDTAVLYSDTIKELTVDALADKIDTIGYELLCAVGARVPRIALKNGKIVAAENYISACTE
ncbi:MAG: alanine racemase [Ruminiclostridium sp.]|nr:alanine racemase [Ruminiclostridium sp.]